jgi:prevent-host-death family protein
MHFFEESNMENLEVFTARDLRQRSGELFSDAERGQLSLITKNGRPAMVAVPFDRRLLESGVHRALALNLFEAGQLSLAQAAKVAGLSQEAFMEVLVEVGIPAVDYPPQELEGELDAAR